MQPPSRDSEPFRAHALLAAKTPGEGRARRKMLAASVATHVLLVAVFLATLHGPADTDRPERVDIVFYPRSLEPREVPQPREMPRPEPEPERQAPDIPEQVALAEPPENPSPPPRPRPEVAPPRPQPEVAPPPPPVVAGQPRPVPTVRTEVFEQARSEPVAPKTPRAEARKGAFSSARVADPRERADSRLRGSTRVGGFQASPASSSAQPTPRSDQRAVVDTDFGSSVVTAAPPETRDRGRGVTQGTAFGGGVTDAPARGESRDTGSVKQGGFGDGVAVARPRSPRPKPVANPDAPVVILSKPKPVYTDEARRLRVEGEVVLDVLFVASGQLRVLGVVTSLGHGLDEAAVDAAKQIEFKPALRNGKPVDHAATLRIVFQLA